MPFIAKKLKEEQEKSRNAASPAAAASAKGKKESEISTTSTGPARSRVTFNKYKTQSGNARVATNRENRRPSKPEQNSSSSEGSDTSSSSSATTTSSSDDSDDDEEEEEQTQKKRQDSSQDGVSQPSGRTKNLAGFWSTQTEDAKGLRRKRIEVADAPDTLVLENEPQRLEGVVRADDPGEWDKPIEIEKGRAKFIATMLQSKQAEAPKVRGKPFKLVDVERGDPVVVENEPVVLEGVVKSGELKQTDEDIFKERGRIRNIAERWKRAQQQQQQLVPSDEEDEDAAPCDKPKKPAWLLELESAKESGVYETESTPMVRDDVVRADDDEPDVISVQRTRNLRKMWTEIEQEKLHGTKEGQEEEEETKRKKQTNRTQKHESSSSSVETDTDSEEVKESSSEGEQEVQRVAMKIGQSRRLPPLTSRQTQRAEMQRRNPSQSPDSSPSSAAKSSIFVNEASLRYAPKK